MMQVIEMTHSEKVEMYQMIEKDRLIEMLIEANYVINRLTEVKNLRIADVSGRSEQSNCVHCHEHILTVKTLKYRCKHCRDEKWEQLD